MSQADNVPGIGYSRIVDDQAVLFGEPIDCPYRKITRIALIPGSADSSQLKTFPGRIFDQPCVPNDLVKPLKPTNSAIAGLIIQLTLTYSSSSFFPHHVPVC